MSIQKLSNKAGMILLGVVVTLFGISCLIVSFWGAGWLVYGWLTIWWRSGLISGLFGTGLLMYLFFEAWRRDSPEFMKLKKRRDAIKYARKARHERAEVRRWHLLHNGKDIGPDRRTWRDFL